MNSTTRIGIRNEAIICDHCGSIEGPFRETFHSSAICIDSETCAARWMRIYGRRKGNEAKS
jgi:hypothetical protein